MPKSSLQKSPKKDKTTLGWHPLRVLTGSFIIFLLAPGLVWGESQHGSDSTEGLEGEFAATLSLQHDELEEEFELLEEEVVYAAAKHEQDISDSPSTITVITREQIAQSPCFDFACLMSQVPELEIRYIEPMMQAVGARALAGDSSDRELVLVDGMDATIEELGIPFWAALPVHLENIDRIEVIRGPGSALYGTNAHSMVTTIVTRRAEKNGGEIFVGAGEHGNSNFNARVGQILGNWRLLLSGSRELGDHWQVKDLRQKEVYRAAFRVDRDEESSSMSLQIGINKFDGLLYNILAPVYLQDTFQANANFLYKNRWMQSRLWADVRRADVKFDFPLYYAGIKMGDFPEILAMASITVDEDTQVSWEPFKDNLFLAGINYRFLTISMDKNDPANWIQHRAGLFIQDEQRLWEKLLLTAGARLDYNSISPLTISPRLAASWRFAPKQVVRLAFGLAYKKPPFIYTSAHINGVKGTSGFPELGEFFRKSIGNDQLKNESVATFEIGYRGQFWDNRLTLEGDAFFSLYRNGLGIEMNMATNSLGLPDLKNSVLRGENLEDINSLGGSVSVTYKIRQALWLNLNYTYRHSAYLGKSVEVSADTGKVRWEPGHLFNTTIQYRFKHGIRMGLSLHARSSKDANVSSDGGPFGKRIWVHNPANVYFNGLLAWRLEFGLRFIETGVRVFDLLNNLFYDTVPVTRFDGRDVGGELNDRRALLYLSAGY